MAEKEIKSCSDCIHYDACYKIEHYGQSPETTALLCELYIDKNDVAPVKHGHREADIKVSRYPKYGEKIKVVTMAKSFKKFYASRVYEIYDEKNEKIDNITVMHNYDCELCLCYQHNECTGRNAYGKIFHDFCGRQLEPCCC